MTRNRTIAGVERKVLGLPDEPTQAADFKLEPMAPCHEREWRRHAASMARPVVTRVR